MWNDHIPQGRSCDVWAKVYPQGHICGMAIFPKGEAVMYVWIGVLLFWLLGLFKFLLRAHWFALSWGQTVTYVLKFSDMWLGHRFMVLVFCGWCHARMQLKSSLLYAYNSVLWFHFPCICFLSGKFVGSTEREGIQIWLEDLADSLSCGFDQIHSKLLIHVTWFSDFVCPSH